MWWTLFSWTLARILTRNHMTFGQEVYNKCDITRSDAGCTDLDVSVDDMVVVCRWYNIGCIVNSEEGNLWHLDQWVNGRSNGGWSLIQVKYKELHFGGTNKCRICMVIGWVLGSVVEQRQRGAGNSMEVVTQVDMARLPSSFRVLDVWWDVVYSHIDMLILPHLE